MGVVVAKIKGRLLTAGCSFTEHCWSTWNTYLGREYEQYVNVGQSGADNATIARKTIANAQPGDTVVIMWTGFDRWSRYSNDVIPLPHDPDNHWIMKGSVKFDKALLVNYYHKIERFMTTIDYVKMVDFHRRLNDYTVYHFPAFPFLLGEIERTIDIKIEKMFNSLDIENNFLDEVSLHTFQIETGQYICYKHKYAYADTHPGPKVQWEYLHQVMLPKLNIQQLEHTNLDEMLYDQEQVAQGNVQ